MLTCALVIKKFTEYGEKGGWIYVDIPAEIVQQLKPNNKKMFRVQGLLGTCAIQQHNLFPKGDGSFMFPIKKTLFKAIHKNIGDTVTLQLALDETPLQIDAEFEMCLLDAPTAQQTFYNFTLSHQRYFNTWILEAKTSTTKANRIAKAIHALENGWKFADMLRNKNI